MWNVIQTQKDADNLINVFGGFHDGCIKEMKYISGEFVAENLSMMPFNTKRELCIIFQRQSDKPCAIEVIFSKLIRMNLSPRDEQYDGIIFGASIFVNEDCIIWVDDDIKADNLFDILKQDDLTWIKAKEMKWRIADEYIGNEEIYISRK